MHRRQKHAASAHHHISVKSLVHPPCPDRDRLKTFLKTGQQELDPLTNDEPGVFLDQADIQKVEFE